MSQWGFRESTTLNEMHPVPRSCQKRKLIESEVSDSSFFAGDEDLNTHTNERWIKRRRDPYSEFYIPGPAACKRHSSTPSCLKISDSPSYSVCHVLCRKLRICLPLLIRPLLVQKAWSRLFPELKNRHYGAPSTSEMIASQLDRSWLRFMTSIHRLQQDSVKPTTHSHHAAQVTK